MRKEKWWALTLLLLTVMFSFLSKGNEQREELEVANTKVTFQIENLTSKIAVYQDREIASDYLVLDNSLPKEKILSIDGTNSKLLPYILVKNYEETDYLKKYPNFIYDSELYQIFTVIINNEDKVTTKKDYLEYLNELKDLSNYYIFYEPKLEDEIVLLRVLNNNNSIILGAVKLE